MAWLWDYLATLAGSASGLTLFFFFGRTLIEHRLRVALSDHNHKLTEALEEIKYAKVAEIENAKHLHAILQAQNKIQFQLVKEKQAEKIALIYEQMMEFRDAAAVAQLTPSEEEAKEYARRYSELRRIIRSNQLWLPMGTSQQLWDFFSENDRCVSDTKAYASGHLDNEKIRAEFAVARRQIFERFKDLERSVLPELEQQFREVLGINEDDYLRRRSGSQATIA